ncbi:MAG: ComEC/Rec2 family competence protein [Segniliparus sp.]|uniref:ComEC/Rec2 family competence protein n=1 Tax=Segniliparus sp. TaxID=2804064 RepID=UPI003F31B333
MIGPARLGPAQIAPAAGAWAGAALAVGLGWRVGAVAAALAATVLIVLAATAMRSAQPRGQADLLARCPRWGLAALVLFAASSALSAARAHEAESHPLARLARTGERAELLVTVWTTDDPRPVRGNRVLVPARLRSPWGGAAVAVLAPRAQYESLSPWQTVTFRAKAAPPRRHDLAVASLTALGPPQSVGPVSWAARTTGGLRVRFAAVCERVLAEDEAKILPAVVLGDSSRISGKLKDEFQDAGLTHLMVVSGANFAIVLGALLFALRSVGAGPRLSAVLVLAALVGLVFLVRPSPSVLRAAAMGALGLVALFAGRRRQAGHALVVAVVALLVVDPALAVDYGFVLSVLATGALLILAPRWQEALTAKGAPSVLAGALAASAAAHVATAPVVAALTGKASLVALAANVVVEPVVGLATVLGCAGVAASALWEPFGGVVVRFAGVPTAWLVAVAKTASACPYGTVRTGSGFSGFAIASGISLMAAGVLWLWRRRTRFHERESLYGLGIIHLRRAGSSGRAVRRAVRLGNTAARPRPRRGHGP